MGHWIVPLEPLQAAPMRLDFGCCRGNRACGRDKGAMRTDEVCGRPLDPFGADTPMRLDCACYLGELKEH